MGRYSSGSEEDSKKRKKKKKKRSRSRDRSESIESKHSTKPKKSKKKKKRKSRSRSRSVEKYRRTRSRSYDRRSRSRSRERYRHRSRSYSRGRYSRSRSRDRRRRRSRSYDSYSRSSRRSYTPDKKSKRNKSSEREDPCANIPGFADMTPGEQAKIRMHMALKAAAAADEKIKGDMTRPGTTLQESMAFSQALQDIESSGFSATSFKSNRGDKKEETVIKDEFTFGTAGELRLDSQRKPVIVDVDNEELAHPSLYTDPEEKLTKWIQKLASMRRKKLEGEVLT